MSILDRMLATHQPLQTGAAAPDFRLQDQNGVWRTLADLTATGPLVLYFYPRDETPGCTAQACKFRDDFAAFSDLGATVAGISDDPVDVHKAFAEHHRLPFLLLADIGNVVHRAFGIEARFGFLRGRVTFVIDQKQKIALTFDSHLRPTAHIGEALTVVQRLVGQK
jgi:peroxiredoxin Q/BCP